MIEPADVAKVEAIYRADQLPRMVEIDSPGGDVDAAMSIGRLIRKAQWSVVVSHPDVCASACGFILAAGVSKTAFGQVIIHRPYLTGSEARPAGYDANYKRIAEVVRAYLVEMNVPSELTERMFAVPPDEGQELTLDELHLYMLDGKDPAYEQKGAAEEAKRYGITQLEERQRQWRRGPSRGTSCTTSERASWRGS